VIRNLYNEHWKDIQFDKIISLAEKFKISSYGRVIGFKEDAEFLKKNHLSMVMKPFL